MSSLRPFYYLASLLDTHEGSLLYDRLVLERDSANTILTPKVRRRGKSRKLRPCIPNVSSDEPSKTP
jgi:hypothetical protein